MRFKHWSGPFVQVTLAQACEAPAHNETGEAGSLTGGGSPPSSVVAGGPMERSDRNKWPTK